MDEAGHVALFHFVFFGVVGESVVLFRGGGGSGGGGDGGGWEDGGGEEGEG